MLVYTNKKGTAFKRITDDDNGIRSDLEYSDLKDLGFKFHSATYAENDDDNDLINAINSMSLKDQIELANYIYHMENSGIKEPYVDPDELSDLKKEYQDELSESVSQDEFEHELITGEDGILEPLNDVYEDLTWYEMRYVLEYLDAHLDAKNWYSWQINGFSQGDSTFVWIYDSKKLPINPHEKFYDDGNYDFYGHDWNEYLTTILYSDVCQIDDCDNHGDVLHDTESRAVKLYYGSPDELNDYMWKMYNMKPAKIHTTYESYDQ